MRSLRNQYYNIIGLLSDAHCFRICNRSELI